MKFGIREICNVVFRAKSKVKIGNTIFKEGQPVLYIDTAKTSTLEGAATTVYAQGGRGNTRLIAWEGEKTLTFTVEDALLSPLGLSVLSGAGLIKGTATEKVHVHTTTMQIVNKLDEKDVGSDGKYNGISDLKAGDFIVDLAEAASNICKDAPLFVMGIDKDGSLTGAFYKAEVIDNHAILKLTGDSEGTGFGNGAGPEGVTVMVDYYTIKDSNNVSEIQIDAENFAGYYYVEADTLFRRQDDGVDMPANITLPNVKIQSNFTFSMASTGDPSTFTFTMDAFPGYTYFDKKKKVLCVIQVIEDATGADIVWNSAMPHYDDETIDINGDGVNDNKPGTGATDKATTLADKKQYNVKDSVWTTDSTTSSTP